MRYTGRQYLDEANQHVLADFGTVEVAGSARMSRVRASLRVANLLDRHYSDTGFVGSTHAQHSPPSRNSTPVR